MSKIYDFILGTTEATEDGSIYHHDHVGHTGYVNVSPQPSIAGISRTDDIGDGILLDIATDGSIYGIERIGGAVDRWVLMRVIRHLSIGASGDDDVNPARSGSTSPLLGDLRDLPDR